MPLREGWQGRFFEDFQVGDVYRHPLGRTITAADNTWFTLVTMNTNELHFIRESRVVVLELMRRLVSYYRLLIPRSQNSERPIRPPLVLKHAIEREGS